MGFFIPADKLSNLKLYKYNAEDHSVISRLFLKRWFIAFEKLFPLWMAPNVITLAGLGFIISNIFVVFYYCPTLTESAPRWCYFFYAFGLFMYQTFDGCDGQHARRTGQSGPLGELFDHSIDAINTTLGSIVFGSVFKMGYGKLLLVSQFATVLNFYCSTWEEYHTHTLFLSSFSGPVEGILMLCAVYITTGIFGPEVWNTKLFDLNLSSIGGSSNFEINASIIHIALGIPSIYFNVSLAMGNVKKYYYNLITKDDLVSKKKAMELTKNAYTGLLPFAIYYITVIGMIYIYPDFLYKHGLALILSIGCVVAFCVGRIILSHLTLQAFPYYNAPMIVPCAQVALVKILTTFYGASEESAVASVSWLAFGVTLGIHIMFVTEIIYEITTYLDIYTLSIKHKKA